MLLERRLLCQIPVRFGLLDLKFDVAIAPKRCRLESTTLRLTVAETVYQRCATIAVCINRFMHLRDSFERVNSYGLTPFLN
jgi:hypothetical protein